MAKQPLKVGSFQRFVQSSLTSQEFAERLIRSGIVRKEQINDAWKKLPGAERAVVGLARLLVANHDVTEYQAIAALEQEHPLLKIGAYVIVDKIGEGGMGQVFRAVHQKMKREVALKVISSYILKDENSVRRFNREVEAGARLSHPNVVTAHDAGEVNGVHYLVMEYVVGVDLGELVNREGQLPFKPAIDYIIQAAQGLNYAHCQGIIHRDIKPANLLLDRQGIVKILDMGLARFQQEMDTADTEGLTGTGMVMGTIDYMAPEQAFDAKAADGRSDIYSLGCTLYFLLTRRSVYEGDSVIKRILAHREQPVPDLRARLPAAPESLQAAFEKMVAKRPADRYPSMIELIGDLERVSTALPDAPFIHLRDDQFSLSSTGLDATIALGTPAADTFSLDGYPTASDPRTPGGEAPSSHTFSTHLGSDYHATATATATPIQPYQSEAEQADPQQLAIATIPTIAIQTNDRSKSKRGSKLTPGPVRASKADPAAPRPRWQYGLGAVGLIGAALLAVTPFLSPATDVTSTTDRTQSIAADAQEAPTPVNPSIASSTEPRATVNRPAAPRPRTPRLLSPAEKPISQPTELAMASRRLEAAAAQAEPAVPSDDVDNIPVTSDDAATAAVPAAAGPTAVSKPDSAVNSSGKGNVLIVGLGDGDHPDLNSALQQARPHDTILIRHRGPLDIGPTDLRGKTPLTFIGDTVEGVDYWPIIRQAAVDPAMEPIETAAPALFYADVLNVSFKKVHLAVGGHVRQPLEAVFKMESGTVAVHESTLTVAADEGKASAIGASIPFVSVTAPKQANATIELDRCVIRGGRLNSVITCRTPASVVVRANGLLWAGGTGDWLRFDSDSNKLDAVIDQSTIYNFNSLCALIPTKADAAPEQAAFRFAVNRSVLVGASQGAQLFSLSGESVARDSLSAFSQLLHWEGQSNLVHRVQNWLPVQYREKVSLSQFATRYGLGPRDLVASDPLFHVYPTGIELQESEPRDFRVRLLSSQRRLPKKSDSSIGARIDTLPHVLACVADRVMPAVEDFTKPRGVPRVLRVNQKDGPYRTLEAAFAEVADDEIIEIEDDAIYVPAVNYEISSARGVLFADKPIHLSLRGTEDSAAVIVLRDSAQRGVLPKFHPDEQPQNHALFLLALAGKSVRLDGLRFRAEIVGETRHSFLYTTASTTRITNCQFVDFSSAPHALVNAYVNAGFAYVGPIDWNYDPWGRPAHGSLLWVENTVLLHPLPAKPADIYVRSSEIAVSHTGAMSPRHITFRNSAIGTNMIGLYDETTAEREFVKYEHCTVLGRPIGLSQERGTTDFRFVNNLVISSDNPVPADPAGIVARLASSGGNNAVWLLNEPITAAMRSSGALRILPGPILRSMPQLSTRVTKDDFLSPFRLKLAQPRGNVSSDSASVGVRFEYLEAR